MSPYANLQLLYGDLHNHCGISYGHGPLEDALRNARERLDFVSVTGHAHWPDMPEPDPDIQYILDFHHEGFARLKAGWPKMMETLKAFNEEGRFIVFPGFEVHFCATGDRNMIYKDLAGDILYPNDLEDLNRQLQELKSRGVQIIAQPHHVGYRKGTRGIDWDSFDPEFAPFVEMLSMHGCSEGSENTRPFLHSMGPSDWAGTIQCGLQKGHVFGFSGGTDHHSAHPGSYGHGMTGLWAKDRTREAIWEALTQRRMFALTGDRMDLRFTLNDAPMGSVIPTTQERNLHWEIAGGGAVDCVDILRDGKLVHRVSQLDMGCDNHSNEALLHTKVFLELGWGARNRICPWDAELGISDGEILAVEPRFRGREVVSPVEAEETDGYFENQVLGAQPRSVSFRAVTRGNPNNFTPATQGLCLEVRLPRTAKVWARLNGLKVEWPVEALVKGARSGRLADIDSPAWRFHRLPLPHQWRWQGAWQDIGTGAASYYLRVRQTNDQWAWCSPVFLRE